jgi:hypothetical protein
MGPKIYLSHKGRSTEGRVFQKRALKGVFGNKRRLENFA